MPWLVGGDFNVILSEEEKMGGLPFNTMDSWEFANCLSCCALVELKIVGNQFTWWNGRVEDDCIFERLDRVLVRIFSTPSLPLRSTT